MEINLHDIKKINVNKIGGDGGTSWRSFVFEKTDGEILEIHLFSKDVTKLIIKKAR